MPGPGKRFQKGEGGRPKGCKNKTTIAIERVYQVCAKANFHPAAVLLDIAKDDKTGRTLKIKCCEILLKYIEGPQPEARALVPSVPSESAEFAKQTLETLRQFSKPLEPIPTPTTPNSVA